MVGSLLDWLELLISTPEGILGYWYTERRVSQWKGDPHDDYLGKGVSRQGRMATSTLQFGPGLKLARVRLRPAGVRSANEGHWLHPHGLILLLLGNLRRAHSLQMQQRSGNGPAIVLTYGYFAATLKLDYHMVFATN
jgi:hypothetical protein